MFSTSQSSKQLNYGTIYQWNESDIESNRINASVKEIMQCNKDTEESQSMLLLATIVKHTLRRIFFAVCKNTWFCNALRVWQLFPICFCPVAWMTNQETRQTDKRLVHNRLFVLQLGSHSKVFEKRFLWLHWLWPFLLLGGGTKSKNIQFCSVWYIDLTGALLEVYHYLQASDKINW